MHNKNLLGIDDSLLSDFSYGKAHPLAHENLLKLKELASAEGFNLSVVSSFRSFEKQLGIWNAKASGNRALLDEKGHELDYSTLSKREIVFSILRWSALPGASRHHWGTDFDVIDLAAKPVSYKVELIPDEVKPDGIFGKFHLWLDNLILNGESHGFFRPYELDLGGVSPEKWHISYAPLSTKYQQTYTLDFFMNWINSKEMDELKFIEIIREEPEKIYRQFIDNTSPPPWA